MIVDVGRFESDAVDAAAVGADGNVVTHPGTSTVGARVAPFIGPRRKSRTGYKKEKS